MAIYALNLILIGVYAFFAKAYADPIQGVRSRSYTVFYFVAALQLLLLLALRQTTVGTDVPSYIRRFQYVNSVNLRTALDYEYNEKGYTILTRLIGKVTMDSHWFLAIMACVCLIPCLVTLKKESPMPFLSLMIYICMQYYTFIFSGLRQGVAYALVFWSYKYIREKKLLPYAILMAIACYMHKSAIFFIPAYFLARIKINKVSLSLFGMAFVLFYLFRRQLAQLVVDELYVAYSVTNVEMSGAWNYMCVGIALLALLMRPQLVQRGVQCDALYVLVILGAILQFSTTVEANGARIAAYYYMFVTILLPQVVTTLKESKVFLIGTYAVITWLLFIYFRLLSNGVYRVVPYRFFWQ